MAFAFRPGETMKRVRRNDFDLNQIACLRVGGKRAALALRPTFQLRIPDPAKPMIVANAKLICVKARNRQFPETFQRETMSACIAAFLALPLPPVAAYPRKAQANRMREP
jgi:hypothetical protein